MDWKAPVGSISIPLQVSGNKAVSAFSSLLPEAGFRARVL
jgi:hypothetical protein